MIRIMACSTLAFVVGGAALAGDTIPEPDLILHGQVCLGSGPATDTDDVSIIARTMVSGQTRDVGMYSMGEQPSAADCLGQTDCYVLRVRLETVPSGAQPSGEAALLTPADPATIQLYIQEGTSPESAAGELPVTDRGMIRRVDLHTTPISADLNADGQRNLADHAILQSALTGPGTPVTQPCDPKDINRDGRIDMADFAILQVELM
jgi:hypothetical protein